MAQNPFIFQYGNYNHAAGEVQLTVTKKAIPSPRGLKMAINETWQLDGILQSTDGTIPTLDAQLQTLQNAYGVNTVTGQVTGSADFQNAKLLYNDGVTPTAHQLISGNSISGTRITGFSFKRGQGAEHAAFRSYTITLEAVFIDATVNLLVFQETVAFKGTGGPRFVALETLDEDPVFQQVAAATTIHCAQSGNAIGISKFVPIPGQLLDTTFEHEEQQEIILGPIEQVGSGLWRYHCSWKYVFEGISLGNALPNSPKSVQGS